MTDRMDVTIGVQTDAAMRMQPPRQQTERFVPIIDPPDKNCQELRISMVRESWISTACAPRVPTSKDETPGWGCRLPHDGEIREVPGRNGKTIWEFVDGRDKVQKPDVLGPRQRKHLRELEKEMAHLQQRIDAANLGVTTEEPVVDAAPVHRCPTCGFEARSERGLATHQRTHNR